MKKKVLMACIQNWDSPFQVGSHHLARCFVRAGYEVAYISSPVTPIHILTYSDSGTRDRFRTFKEGGERHCKNDLWAYVPFALVSPDGRPLLNREWFIRNWSILTVPSVIHRVVREGFGDVDILYLDSIFQSFWLKSIQYRTSVFRIMDNHLGFPGWGSGVGRLTKDVAKTADVVVYSAETLEPYARGMEPKKAVYLPNGIDFDSMKCGSRKRPAIMENIPRPIAIYVGAMETWFDFALLEETARALPDLSFVLIGPDSLARPKVGSLPNVFLLGPVKHDHITRYLYNADVGIIPFNVSEYPLLVHSVNPLKLYEYMACGLPVVSVEWEELKRIKSPAMLCRGKNDFIRAVERAVHAPGDRNEFVQFAEKHDWSRTFQKLQGILEGRKSE